jgi:hypothetical protein
MRSGLLAREFISLYRYENIQSSSGEITKEKKLIKNTRAYVIKSSLNTTNEEQAKELFDQPKLVFQVRFIPDLTDQDILEYNNNEYRIIHIDQNIWDRTLKISAVKINK